MRIADSAEFLKALLNASRPGSDRILAFYDSRVDLICRDASLLLIPLDDHMCHRGDGLFESIAFRDRRIFALDAHLSRLEDGSRILDIKPPCDFARIEEIIKDAASAGGAAHGDLRVFLSRGPGGFGISPRECPKSSLYVVCLAKALPEPELYERGLSAFASSVPPKQDYLATIKNTNYLPNVFMAREACAKGMDVAITFDGEGHMGEAAIANAAIVDADGCFASPGFQRILPGTTLLAAARLARQKMRVAERHITRSDILSAREMLLFTSSTLCVALPSVDGHPIANGRPGPVARWLKDALLEEMLRNGAPF